MAQQTPLIEAARQGDTESVARILDRDPRRVSDTDERGASALHYAALGGHRETARKLVQPGAQVNHRDLEWRATPAGWAIEYLRVDGALLGIEIDDLGFAIDRGEADWARRFLARFSALRHASGADGVALAERAQRSGSDEIASLFEVPPDELGG